MIAVMGRMGRAIFLVNLEILSAPLRIVIVRLHLWVQSWKGGPTMATLTGRFGLK